MCPHSTGPDIGGRRLASQLSQLRCSFTRSQIELIRIASVHQLRFISINCTVPGAINKQYANRAQQSRLYLLSIVTVAQVGSTFKTHRTRDTQDYDYGSTTIECTDNTRLNTTTPLARATEADDEVDGCWPLDQWRQPRHQRRHRRRGRSTAHDETIYLYGLLKATALRAILEPRTLSLNTNGPLSHPGTRSLAH